jgi:hypothetical protein
MLGPVVCAEQRMREGARRRNARRIALSEDDPPLGVFEVRVDREHEGGRILLAVGDGRCEPAAAIEVEAGFLRRNGLAGAPQPDCGPVARRERIDAPEYLQPVVIRLGRLHGAGTVCPVLRAFGQCEEPGRSLGRLLVVQPAGNPAAGSIEQHDRAGGLDCPGRCRCGGMARPRVRRRIRLGADHRRVGQQQAQQQPEPAVWTSNPH